MDKDKLIESVENELFEIEYSDRYGVENRKEVTAGIFKAINDAGFVIVPREATEEMIKACADAGVSVGPNNTGFWTDELACKAMIKAGEIK